MALPPVKRKLRTMQSATLLSLSRETILQSNSQDLVTSTYQHKLKQNTAATRHTSQTQKNALRSVILLSQLLTNNGTTLYSTPLEAQKTASLLVRSSIATTPCRSAARQARIEVTAAYALNYLELRPASPRFLNSAIAAIIARAANMMALVGTVLYNAIKEYHDDRIRKTIYFYGHTIEAIHANHIENSRSNVTVPDDYHDNDVDNILMKCTDNERQQYNTLIEDYNCAGKREDNILTIDECRTGHSNEEDIEADEREEETRVRLRELSEEIHDILLREFRGANDFTESVTYNDDEQSIVTDSTWDEFAMLAEEYTIDNRIELELEDCDALVERYKEEINCSDLYSTM
ncbi:hypothetical protein HBI90_019080 [Parastagonospora nodorum]|nr:hypothetical protein HBI90_019080 [Parastagonospora nodorum]